MDFDTCNGILPITHNCRNNQACTVWLILFLTSLDTITTTTSTTTTFFNATPSSTVTGDDTCRLGHSLACCSLPTVILQYVCPRGCQYCLCCLFDSTPVLLSPSGSSGLSLNVRFCCVCTAVCIVLLV